MLTIKKYDGCGNTFAAIDHEAVKDMNFSQLAIDLCNDDELNTDGLIIAKKDPLEMIFYNRDGSLATMCGNGLRAFSKYVMDHDWLPAEQEKFDVITGAGLLNVQIDSLNPFLCTINLGRPKFTSASVKLADDGPLSRKIEMDGEEIDIHAVFMATVHTVIFVDTFEGIKDGDFAKRLHEHPLFTEKTNVNFVKVIDDQTLAVRTFERGVDDFTLACGTGCAAAYVIAKRDGLITGEQVRVLLEEGELHFTGDEEIYMTGPARYHFTIRKEVK